MSALESLLLCLGVLIESTRVMTMKIFGFHNNFYDNRSRAEETEEQRSEGEVCSSAAIRLVKKPVSEKLRVDTCRVFQGISQATERVRGV